MEEAAVDEKKVPEIREWGGVTHHFTILAKKQIGDGENDFVLKEWDGYIHTHESSDGSLVGVSVKIAKSGSKLSGMLDGHSRMFTKALQCGASVEELCRLMIATQFEPAGPTKNPDIPRCTSLLDYVGKWLWRYAKTTAEVPDEPEVKDAQAVQG